jgi:hypothetical protein
MMMQKLLSRFSYKKPGGDDDAYTIHNKSDYSVYILRVKPIEQNFVGYMFIEPNQVGKFQYTRGLKLMYLAKRDFNIICFEIRQITVHLIHVDPCIFYKNEY